MELPLCSEGATPHTTSVGAEEGRDPLMFIVFVSSTSLDARESTEYDNVQKQEAWWN